MDEVLVNRLGGLSLPRKSVVRLTDRPDMTLDVHRGHKTRIQQQELESCSDFSSSSSLEIEENNNPSRGSPCRICKSHPR